MEEKNPVSRQKWFALGCLTSLVLIVLAVSIGVTALLKSKATTVKPVKSDSYLRISLSGQISEYNEIEDDLIFENNTQSAETIIEKIRAAAKDDKIVGILLEPRYVVCGSVVADNIGQALMEFRAVGKPVYAYVEQCSDRDYYLCSFADTIVMPPVNSASITLTGVGSRVNFYKKLLDKLGIEFKVVHAGKYKGTGESYVLDQMSPEFRENLQGVVDSTYIHKLQQLAENRSLSLDKVRALYEQRTNLFVTPTEAVVLGMIDKLAYRSDMLKNLIRSKHILPMKDYQAEPPVKSSDDKIAVVYMQGEIMDQVSEYQQNVITYERFEKVFDAIEKDHSVKAVVLRVNSPGGSALESDIVWNRINQLKSQVKTVVSMGNVAASGGYYISCGADYIMAEPYTITGSIGVVSAIPNASKAMTKLGISPQRVARGKFATSFDPMLPFDENDISSLESHSQAIYAEFKQRVADGRGMTPEEVEAIAQGRVYNANKALEIKLIDGVGTLDDAVKKAAELAGVEEYQVTVYPEQHSMLETLLKSKLDLNSVRSNIRGEILTDFGGLPAEVVTEFFRREPVQLLAPASINEE